MNGYDIRDLGLAGVKWEISDIPVALRAKWDAAAPTTPAATKSVPAAGVNIVPPISPVANVSVETAESMASRPADIDNLIRLIGEFNHPLRSAATQVVFPNIAKNPNGLVVVTDVPGSDDDASGHILSGAVGELFDKMLGAIGMDRDSVSIIPIIFWRTPGGRTPNTDELALARPFVNRLLEFLHPRVILTLGATPAKEIANVQLSRDQGGVTELGDGKHVMSIYHPNYLLLKPSAKRDVWTALQNLQILLKNQ
jgi:DNA polymerase